MTAHPPASDPDRAAQASCDRQECLQVLDCWPLPPWLVITLVAVALMHFGVVDVGGPSP